VADSLNSKLTKPHSELAGLKHVGANMFKEGERLCCGAYARAVGCQACAVSGNKEQRLQASRACFVSNSAL
jgi:hypothetical protein